MDDFSTDLKWMLGAKEPIGHGVHGPGRFLGRFLVGFEATMKDMIKHDWVWLSMSMIEYFWVWLSMIK